MSRLILNYMSSMTVQVQICPEISKHKRTWICHTLMKHNSNETEALDWNPQGRRKGTR